MMFYQNLKKKRYICKLKDSIALKRVRFSMLIVKINK